MPVFLHTFQRENTYAKLHENAPFEMKNYKKFLDTPFPDLTPPRRFRCLDAPAFHGQLARMSSDPRNAPGIDRRFN